MEMTRSAIEHVLKVAIWKKFQKGDLNLEWKHLYLCGTNVAAYADTDEELGKIIKDADLPIFPKILYKPPNRSRYQYFEAITDLDEDTQYDLLSSATCVMPGGAQCIIETYDISPFEIAYVRKEHCYKQMRILLMIMNRFKIRLPAQLRADMFSYLLQTSNTGFIAR